MLYGKNIRLRSPERGDVPTFTRWLNDPEVRQYLLLFEPVSSLAEERWVERLDDSKGAMRSDYVFVIEAPLGDQWEMLGNVGLHAIDWKNRHAIFGIVLGEKSRWGAGFGTDATLTMLDFAFGTLNLHRVELEVFDFNLRAQRCYEKAGFTREGLRRQSHYRDGAYGDAVIMGILKQDWVKASCPQSLDCATIIA